MTRSIATIFALFIILFIFECTCFYTVLSKKHSPEKADLTAVFMGGAGRAEYGYKLAKSGATKYVTFSPAESEKIQSLEGQFGILDSGVSLIIEEKARTTFENALYVKEIVSNNGFKSIILITSFYHMPRSYFLLRTMLFGSDVKIIPVIVPTEKINENNWFKESKGRRLIANELIKFWGSLLEVGMYTVKRDVPQTSPKEMKVLQFLRSKLLFKITGIHHPISTA
ncbi:MAG: YdcF family protein [Candidatus Brocadiaceae bacterium]|nr:YdcF family protein [Candidatus Brocadiaceae bacterium]